MAASPEAMRQMAQTEQAGGPTAPAPSPATQPTGQEGSKQLGAIKVQTAMLMLQSALANFDLRTPEGQALLDVLKKLAMRFGQPAAQELVPAQIMQMAREAQTQGSVPLAQ